MKDKHSVYYSGRNIRYLVIHCSATKMTTDFSVSALRHLHVDINHWQDIGYNFYITKDGIIHKCRPLTMVGAHCSGYNATSIGVCYEGGLDAEGKPADTRTQKQLHSMRQLLSELKKEYPLACIVGHYELGARKACPCFCASKFYADLDG